MRSRGGGSTAGEVVGGPVLTFAITPRLYVDDGPPTAETVADIAAEPDED